MAPSPRTAPCNRCGILVVFGQRQCFRCKEPFNYGANPPAIPSQEILEQVYHHGMQLLRAKEQVQVQPLPAQAPLINGAKAWEQQIGAVTPAESFVETGRFAAVDLPPSASASVEGLIDSRLYGAFTPERVHAPPMEGLMQTQQDMPADIPAGSNSTEIGVMRTGYAEVGEVATAAPEGFIDSTLFAQYTPAHIEIEAMPGVERLSENLISNDAQQDSEKVCVSCKTPVQSLICGSCGIRQPEEE